MTASPSFEASRRHSESVGETLQQALYLHRQGRIADAVRVYRQIIAENPHHADALHLIGVAANQRGDWMAAVEAIRKAIRINPDNPIYHNNLGNAYKEGGRLEAAVSAFQQALQLKPDLVPAYVNLGNALIASDRTSEAVCAYEAALRYDPNQIEALYNLGNIQKAGRQMTLAVRYYQQVIDLKPDFVEAHYNLANTLVEMDRLHPAIDSYRTCMQIKPDWADAYTNLGNALLKLGQADAALDCFDTAVRLDPTSCEAHNNRGNALKTIGRVKDAAACFDAALKLKPDDAVAMVNRGVVLLEAEHVSDALQCFHRAVELKNDLAEAHSSAGIALAELGRTDEAISAFRGALDLKPEDITTCSYLVHQLQHTCHWPEFQNAAETLDGLEENAWRQGKRIAEPPFIHMARNADLDRNLKVATIRSADIARPLKGYRHLFPHDRQWIERPKLTIGYLSGDFHDHATGHLMRGLFECHDRERFVINAYSFGPDDQSTYRHDIINSCDRFVDIRHHDHLAAARQIYEDRVDILVDLKGHTRGGRLAICALRPAPVTVGYLGYPGTTGADFIDYIITDRLVTPPDHQPYYTERFAFLPDCYQVNDDRQGTADRRFSKSDVGMPAMCFAFCSFNQPYKIDPVIYDVWMKILKQVPNSVLWLFSGGKTTDDNLRSEAEKRGVDGGRLLFAEKWPKADHMARLQAADLALDTRVVNGHTTTSDALWAGVPVITLIGGHFASRVSASLLTHIGLEELIAPDLAGYESRAVRLAMQPTQLQDVRDRLNRNRHTKPLFDTRRFASNLERLYSTMWRRYREQKPPEPIG